MKKKVVTRTKSKQRLQQQKQFQDLNQTISKNNLTTTKINATSTSKQVFTPTKQLNKIKKKSHELSTPNQKRGSSSIISSFGLSLDDPNQSPNSQTNSDQITIALSTITRNDKDCISVITEDDELLRGMDIFSLQRKMSRSNSTPSFGTNQKFQNKETSSIDTEQSGQTYHKDLNIPKSLEFSLKENSFSIQNDITDKKKGKRKYSKKNQNKENSELNTDIDELLRSLNDEYQTTATQTKQYNLRKYKKELKRTRSDFEKCNQLQKVDEQEENDESIIIKRYPTRNRVSTAQLFKQQDKLIHKDSETTFRSQIENISTFHDIPILTKVQKRIKVSKQQNVDRKQKRSSHRMTRSHSTIEQTTVKEQEKQQSSHKLYTTQNINIHMYVDKLYKFQHESKDYINTEHKNRKTSQKIKQKDNFNQKQFLIDIKPKQQLDPVHNIQGDMQFTTLNCEKQKGIAIVANKIYKLTEGDQFGVNLDQIYTLKNDSKDKWFKLSCVVNENF